MRRSYPMKRTCRGSGGRAQGSTVINVRQVSERDPLQFDVTIDESGSQTHHRVVMSASDHQRLTGGACRPEQCIEAAFRFLLDREPKESILRRFDINVISRYFPDFEAKLVEYTTVGSAS